MRVSRAQDFLQSRIADSVRKQWFGWTAGRRFGSIRRAGTGSAEGCRLGCVAGDAFRREAGAAFFQAAFDMCLKVVDASGPLTG